MDIEIILGYRLSDEQIDSGIRSCRNGQTVFYDARYLEAILRELQEKRALLAAVSEWCDDGPRWDDRSNPPMLAQRRGYILAQTYVKTQILDARLVNRGEVSDDETQA